MKSADFASAILWNRSTLNGAAWMSCILILEGEVLELRGDSGTVFRSPVSAVTARIPPMGDLEIRTAGDPARYRLTVYANMTTPLLTPRQVRVLRDAQLRTNTSQRARPVIPEWRRVLAESGGQARAVAVTARSTSSHRASPCRQSLLRS